LLLQNILCMIIFRNIVNSFVILFYEANSRSVKGFFCFNKTRFTNISILHTKK